MTKATYEKWLLPAKTAHRENGTLIVPVDKYAAEWLHHRLRTPTERAARDVLGDNRPAIEFISQEISEASARCAPRNISAIWNRRAGSTCAGGCCAAQEELDGWFHINRPAEITGESRSVVLALADRWEQLGYLTEVQRDELGHVKGRRITDTLALVAESGESGIR